MPRTITKANESRAGTGALAAAANLFEKLAALAQRDKHFAEIATVWFNAIWLNDFRISGDARVELGKQIMAVLPIEWVKMG